MERQTSEKNDLPISALLESMLKKLTTNQSLKNVETNTDRTSQHTSHRLMKMDGQTAWTMKTGAAVLVMNERESSAQQSYKPSPDHSVFEEGVSQTEFEDQLFDAACGPSKLSTGIGAVSRLDGQKRVNVTGRTERFVSGQVEHKSEEHRTLSHPSISHYKEPAYKVSTNNYGNTGKASVPKERKGTFLGQQEESFVGMEHEMLLLETQKKGVKTQIQNHTQKMFEKPEEHHECERNCNQHSAEDETQSLSSVEIDAPSLPIKKRRYVHLQRTFTLKDFKLDLEPINLMEEIFTGEEWSKYLPSKTSSAQMDAGDQAMGDDVLHVELTTEQNQSENRNSEQSDVKQEMIYEADTSRKVNRHFCVSEAEPNANIIAIPKALLTNATEKQAASGKHPKSKTSVDSIHECAGIFMIPKHDFMLLGTKSKDISLDFSAVKPFGLLDHSAQKTRIRLSKKRRHRPPKKHRKEKITAKFYKIPSAFLTQSTTWESSSPDSIIS